MSKIRRIVLDWTNLFAFEQAENASAQDMRIARRVGEKVGGKRIPLSLNAKVGDKTP